MVCVTQIVPRQKELTSLPHLGTRSSASMPLLQGRLMLMGWEKAFPLGTERAGTARPSGGPFDSSAETRGTGCVWSEQAWETVGGSTFGSWWLCHLKPCDNKFRGKMEAANTSSAAWS